MIKMHGPPSTYDVAGSNWAADVARDAMRRVDEICAEHGVAREDVEVSLVDYNEDGLRLIVQRRSRRQGQ